MRGRTFMTFYSSLREFCYKHLDKTSSLLDDSEIRIRLYHYKNSTLKYICKEIKLTENSITIFFELKIRKERQNCILLSASFSRQKSIQYFTPEASKIFIFAHQGISHRKSSLQKKPICFDKAISFLSQIESYSSLHQRWPSSFPLPLDLGLGQLASHNSIHVDITDKVRQAIMLIKLKLWVH
jgi:hypothetical protein